MNEICCARCQNADGPFVETRDGWFCEPCARPMPLTEPIGEQR